MIDLVHVMVKASGDGADVMHIKHAARSGEKTAWDDGNVKVLMVVWRGRKRA